MTNEEKIPDHLIDELLAGRDAKEVFSREGLLDELKQALAERILNAEMDVHLDRDEERSKGNHRNGHSQKTVLTENGSLPLFIPRDRQGRFEPQLIEKYRRRFPDFDRKIIALYARGLSTREIQAHVRELYGVEISPALVSAVTDAVHDEVSAWQSRPLEQVYAVVFFDALRVKIRSEGRVNNQAVYLAIGVRCTGHREILGLWIEQNEGANFWLGVMNELKGRGTEDVLIAVVDGLKGFPEAIEAVFPKATVQTCIVHLLRNSMKFASWKERKHLAGALKPIYGAPTEKQARIELDRFANGEWGQKYPPVTQSWERHWEQVIPFFAFSRPIRRMIYTTNAIESLHSQVRRAIRKRGHFPNERAASKLIYLALQQAQAKWKNPPPFWHEAKNQFAIRFEERFILDD
jgi:putative transposase